MTEEDLVAYTLEKAHEIPSSRPISWERIDMELLGGCVSQRQVETHKISPWGQNYYLAHCPQGILDVRSYGEVIVRGGMAGSGLGTQA